MEIVLARHAEPEWVKNDLNVDDPPLTTRGHRQAELLARRLAGERFDAIYVSPLVRARQTAAPLVDMVEATRVETREWLEEIRNPIWHGTPREKADAAYAEERARPAVERWSGLEGGESVRDFVSRIQSGALGFFGEHGMTHSGQSLPVWSIERSDLKILLVAHAGTNSVVIGTVLGLEPTPWEWERFVLGHASISRLVSYEIGDGHTFGLVRLSDVEHLPPESRTA